MIELVEDKLDIDTYLEHRQSVNFRKLTRDQAKKGLSNSMYTKTERQLAWAESKEMERLSAMYRT